MQEYPKALYRGDTETAVVKDAESEAAHVADGWRTSFVPVVAPVVDETAVDKPKRGRKAEPEAE